VDVYEAMRTTPATRSFLDEPVPPETLHRILDHARFAPSGGNRQGWRVVVVEDPASRRRLRDLYVLGWREYTAHLAEGLVPFAPVGGTWEGPAVDLEAARRRESPHPFADNLDTVPVMLVVVVDLGAVAVMDNGLGRQSIVGGGSVYPFIHNILLAARNEGLGAVMTTAICREEPAVKELLGIPDGHAVAGLVALGRPRRPATRLTRLPVEAFTSVDTFDGPAFTAHTAGRPGST
jgi:nitroreductase